LLISVPHAGVWVPPEVKDLCLLTAEEIAADGDEGAREIYQLDDDVAGFVTTEVARAIVDMNRSEDDRRRDGVVKTHTCWDVPVYREELPDSVVEDLLNSYYRPYHRRLTDLATNSVRAGLDCHTMSAVGPPVGSDPGSERPAVCLSNGHGATCPNDWLTSLERCLKATFDQEVRVNSPFTGGFICRFHCREVPWIQLETSRANFMSTADKMRCVKAAIREWCAVQGWL
jgi:formiminoglutamase